MAEQLPSDIQQLLSVKEELEHLSSNQIAQILDSLLLNALTPLVTATKIPKEWLTELMPLLMFDGRRKISGVERDELLNLMYAVVFEEDTHRITRLLKQLGLERNFLFQLIERFLKATEGYPKLMTEHLRETDPNRRAVLSSQMLDIENQIGSDRTLLYPAIQHAEFWFYEAYRFKWMVAQKFYKLAWKSTKAAIKSTTMRISRKDLFKNYVLAINRAIDKYNPERGTLASYVLQWFKDANVNSEFNHQVELAYDMPTSRLRAMADEKHKRNPEINLAHNIEDPAYEQHLRINPQEGHIDPYEIKLLKYASSKIGLFMLSVGVDYPLDDQEIEQLKATIH